METATYRGDLQRLAQQLQTQLLTLPEPALMQIQCVIRQGNLMVLGQHPSGKTPDTRVVFGALEQAIQTLLPELGSEIAVGKDEAYAKLYLRVLGQRQPYAAHSFQLATPVTEPSTAEEPFEPLAEATGEEQGSSDDASVDQRELISSADLPDTESADLTQLSPRLEEPVVNPSLQTARSPLMPWLLAGIGVSVLCFAAGLWVMSRPCIAGACEPLQAAQTLGQRSTQTIQAAKTEQDLQQAQQQLSEAQRRLQDIPAWSSHQQEAQALQQTYQSQMQTLDLVLAAESQADAAIRKSQALPQSTAVLQATQALWREAIAPLQTVPQTNALYAFAQQRLTAYETNLAAIGKLVTAEQQAQKKLSLAKETAKTADARQGIAQTPENWQLAQSTWQVAINTLREIPTSTTSNVEAQQLLSGYQAKLAAARDRATQEQIAKKAFTQALALAQKAETAQRQNQWSEAVANWREALTNVKQVPNNTAYSEPAQPLVASYSTSLKQAEAQLQVAAAMQRTRDDLNRLCAGSPRMCSYTIANNVLRVQFTASYERQLRTAFIVGRSGDKGTLGGVVNHIETLQTALQTIADNAALPLEVYSADGSELIGSFNPKG